MAKLRDNKGCSSSSSSEEVTNLTHQALSYVRERNTLWIKQDVKKDSDSSNNTSSCRKNNEDSSSCDFDRDNLPYLK